MAFAEPYRVISQQVGRRRAENDRDVLGKWVQSQEGADLETCLGRSHPEVEDDEIRKLVAQEGRSLQTIGAGDNLVALIGQRIRHVFEEVDVIVDDCDARHVPFSRSLGEPLLPFLGLIPVGSHDSAATRRRQAEKRHGKGISGVTAVQQLCVMDEVGVRELRQNLSVYLRRVARGEHFLVTERHSPVAVLGPPPAVDDAWERLIAEGRMSRLTRDIKDLAPPVRLDDPYAGTKALEQEREERLP